jgi:hypothetical protein
MDGNCGRPPADGAAVRLRRTALEDGPGGQRTSVGSSDASGHPPDAAVDVRTRDNPGPACVVVDVAGWLSVTISCHSCTVYKGIYNLTCLGCHPLSPPFPIVASAARFP